MRRLPNLVAIGQTVAEIWRFFYFSKMAAVRHLGFVMRVFGPPTKARRVFVGLYHCGKFGWNRYSTFNNMQVLTFCEFGLKTPIHAPDIGVLPGKVDQGSLEFLNTCYALIPLTVPDFFAVDETMYKKSVAIFTPFNFAWWVVFRRFAFHQNRSSGFGAVESKFVLSH